MFWLGLEVKLRLQGDCQSYILHRVPQGYEDYLTVQMTH